MIKKILLIAALILPVFASAQTLKIGIVDFDEILGKLPDTADAEKKLGEISKAYEDEFNNMQAELKSQYEAFQALAADTPDAIKARKADQIQETSQKIEQFSQTASQELQKKQAELLQPIYQKINNAIQSVGQEGGYSLIQMKNTQLIPYFSSPVEEVTNQVKAKLGI